MPCACSPCTQLRFNDCEIKELLDCKVQSVKAPRAAGETAGLRQMDSLQAWAASLKSKQLVAVRVVARERSIEGVYWLAILKGKPFEATQHTLSATDEIEEGYLVVKAQWLKLENKDLEGGMRSYTLLDTEVTLVVNHMVHLTGLQFSAFKGDPQGRELRGALQAPKAPKGKAKGKGKEAGAKLHYISRETDHSILACCDTDSDQ